MSVHVVLQFALGTIASLSTGTLPGSAGIKWSKGQVWFQMAIHLETEIVFVLCVNTLTTQQ